jgi:hypothetical protein
MATKQSLFLTEAKFLKKFYSHTPADSHNSASAHLSILRSNSALSILRHPLMNQSLGIVSNSTASTIN